MRVAHHDAKIVCGMGYAATNWVAHTSWSSTTRTRPQDWISVEDAAKGIHKTPWNQDLEVLSKASTLNDALDAMLTSKHQFVVVTGDRNKFEGVMRADDHGSDGQG